MSAQIRVLLLPQTTDVLNALLDQEDDLCTCFTLGDTDGSNWREGLQEQPITDCSQARKSALEDERNSDSSDEEVEFN